MKLLFTSDLHGQDRAFERFTDELRTGPYDLGVLGGDLVDEWFQDDLVLGLTGAHPDELLDELPTEGEDPVALWNASGAKALQDRAHHLRIAGLQTLLGTAGKPVLFVLGNHDRTPWPPTPGLTDLHLNRVEVGGRAFVGYRWTTLERSPEESEADLEVLQSLVDRDTVLVTHSPPWGILDGQPEWGTNYGLPMLNRLRPKPWLHLVGHVHSLAGRRGRYVNGCWPTVRRFFAIDVDRRHVRKTGEER